MAARDQVRRLPPASPCAPPCPERQGEAFHPQRARLDRQVWQGGGCRAGRTAGGGRHSRWRAGGGGERRRLRLLRTAGRPLRRPQRPHGADRKSVVEGKSVSVRVVLGGSRIIKKKKK